MSSSAFIFTEIFRLSKTIKILLLLGLFDFKLQQLFMCLTTCCCHHEIQTNTIIICIPLPLHLKLTFKWYVIVCGDFYAKTVKWTNKINLFWVFEQFFCCQIIHLKKFESIKTVTWKVKKWDTFWSPCRLSRIWIV